MSLKSEVEKLPGYNTVVRPWHLVRATAAGVRFGWPAKKLRVIAVTGTNGKTSTCWFIWKMLNTAGRKTGLLTTVGWGVEEIFPQVEHMTTERVEVLFSRIRAVAESGAEFLVLETTSHALCQFRTLGVPIEVAVFTNLTPEHLDYHKTMEKYAKAKQKLFKKARYAVINADDGYGELMAEGLKNSSHYSSGDIISYGIDRGDLRATEVKLKSSGVEYIIDDMKIKTQIPGKFNVYNSLAAVGVGKKLGLTKDEIVDGIAALESVEGRMTRVDYGQKFEVIVDYAHQPDALEKIFESVRSGNGRAVPSEQTCLSGPSKARIIAVHGGAGRRDPGTREPRGEILGKYADLVIITEDDSRDENPAEIAESFVCGAEKAGKIKGKDLIVELDRKKAIELAIKKAKPGDLVLILGKGHEKTILRADGPHKFEDIKVVREALAKNGLKD